MKSSFGDLKEEKIVMLREIEELQSNEQEVKEDISDLEIAIDENLQQSQRYSVRITATNCSLRDTEEQLAEKCIKVFTDGKVEMSRSDIKRVRVIGKTAVVEFNNWGARVRATTFNRDNRRKTKTRVQPNLTKRRFDLLHWTQLQIRTQMIKKHGTDNRNIPRKDNVFALANSESNLLICAGGKFVPFFSQEEAMETLNQFFKPQNSAGE